MLQITIKKKEFHPTKRFGPAAVLQELVCNHSSQHLEKKSGWVNKSPASGEEFVWSYLSYKIFSWKILFLGQVPSPINVYCIPNILSPFKSNIHLLWFPNWKPLCS